MAAPPQARSTLAGALLNVLAFAFKDNTRHQNYARAQRGKSFYISQLPLLPPIPLLWLFEPLPLPLSDPVTLREPVAEPEPLPVAEPLPDLVVVAIGGACTRTCTLDPVVLCPVDELPSGVAVVPVIPLMSCCCYLSNPGVLGPLSQT